MKKLLTINIAGLAFKFDSEAFELLNSYLNKINDHYKNAADGAEIISDIEARIAEIILSKQERSSVVTKNLVDSIVSQLGSPEEILGSETEKSDSDAPEPSEEQPKTEKIPRRLYRNPEGSKIAGVCSGLAVYFNIDVIWVRLIFLFPFILSTIISVLTFPGENFMFLDKFNFSPIIYIILVIVVPKAKTPLQRLEMKGEKITAANIEQGVRKATGKAETKISEKGACEVSIFTNIITTLWKLILFFIKIVIAFCATVIALCAIVLCGILLFTLVLVVGLCITGTPKLDYTSISTVNSSVVILGLLCIVPITIGIYFIFKLILGFRVRKWVVFSMIGVWVVAFIVALTPFGHSDKIKSLKIKIRETQFAIPYPLNNNNNDAQGIAILTPPSSKDTLKLTGKTLYLKSLENSYYDTYYNVNIVKGEVVGTYPVLDIKYCYKDAIKDAFFGNKLKRLNLTTKLEGDTLFIADLYKSTKIQQIYFRILLPDSIDVVAGKMIKIKE